MISVTFTSDVENIVATEHLYQWDNGQKLSISGVGTTADVHFANKKSEKALVVTPTITSGAMVAFIPNSLLAEPYPIIAYVYVPSDDGSKTIKSITINVEARKQPSDFVLEEDVGVTTLESISQRANEMIQNATNQVNTAISNMNADYSNFKNTIQGELADMVANTTIPNADKLDGYHIDSLHCSYYTTDNADKCINPGTYICAPDSTVNIPFNSWGILDVSTSSDKKFRIQRYVCVFDMKIRYIRVYVNDKYTPWKSEIDGGNADTVDGKHASDFALKTDIPTSLPANGGNANTANTAGTANTANTAGTANTANTAGTLATTPTNICLRNISFGTAQPQITNPNTDGYVAPGALYAVYE